MKVKEGEIISLVSFSRWAGIPSGPQALWISKDSSSSETPLVSTMIGFLSGADRTCNSGGVSVVIGVNTDVKYSLSVCALTKLSLITTSLTCNSATPQRSFF